MHNQPKPSLFENHSRFLTKSSVQIKKLQYSKSPFSVKKSNFHQKSLKMVLKFSPKTQFLVFGSAIPHHSENSNGLNEDAFDNLRNDFFFSSFHNDGKRKSVTSFP